ncbi:MAG: SH3 domain-containing protein [Alphaproteobacteria bacterium]|nr:SH3 domain-containing protein [Alphaproteobacteria bacterium]MBL6938760.1 SH3 domain-containing protein [Alphaproteobacteria bacterium]MBL7097883.1 SH3 domain-containing protein [Alphaproteobacteria bacterium]
MAARSKGFARRLAAERLAESLGVDARAQPPDVKAVPLRVLPLIQPHRSRGLHTVRIERVPQLARLTRGRNNGNGSWSLLLDEVDGVEYVGPDSALDRPALALRLLDRDGGTIAMLELPVDASVAEDLTREAVDIDYLRRLTEELQSARNALVDREKELSELRRAPRQDSGDLQRRLEAAAQLAQEQAKKLWQDDERARFAAAEAHWRESAEGAAADAQTKAVAAIRDAEARAAQQIADAERTFRDRLAAAEAKARDAGTAVAAGQAASAEAQRLREQVTTLEATLRRRDDDFGLMRRDATAAQQRAKDDLAAAERQWQAKSADELKRLTARAETAERALAGNRDAQGSRDAELRTLQQKLADSDRALNAARDAQASRDAELRSLRDERTALEARLADAASKGVPADAVDRQIESALSSARQKWEADAAARLARAEAAFQIAAAEAKARTDALASAPAGPSAADIACQVETAVTAAKAEWQAGEVLRIAAAEARVRAELPPPPAPKGVAPEAVQAKIDAALASARAAWKSEESTRLAQAEGEWRTDSVARLTRRAEAAEAALAEAQSVPPPASFDDAHINGLRREIEELRKALSDREVETAQLRASLESRRSVRESKPKFFPEPAREPEHEMTIHDSGRRNRKMLRDIAFIFGAVAIVAFGFPFVVPYLPYEMQDGIAQLQASVFGTVPAGYATAPAAKPAPAAATPAAATGAPAVIARTANIHAGASAGADVVTRLKKGDPVIALETQGDWTHVKTANIDGWVLTSSLKK